MDLFGWFGLVVFCSLWIRALAGGMGRSFLSDLHGASPILLEIGYWDVVLCVWAVFAVFSILAISVARSKNTRKLLYGARCEEKEIRHLPDHKEGQRKGKRFFI